MENEIKKSYNPFKMFGAWIGFVFPIITWILLIFLAPNYADELAVINPLSLLFLVCSGESCMGVGILSLFTLPIVYFIIGWGIHSLFRK